MAGALMAGGSKAALTVEAALARVLADVDVIADVETVAVGRARGRVLASDLAAALTQPPFDASAMDGYAVRAADVTKLPAQLIVVGEAAAGHGFAGTVGAGQAVRIFTGAPLPAGADAVVIQENTTRDGGTVTVVTGVVDRDHVRPRGGDFSAGQALLKSGTTLGARDLLLAAGMGYGVVPVRRRPRVAIIATGDELVLPGVMPVRDQIVCSNPIGVGVMLEAVGAATEFLGIARDTKESLAGLLARARDADIVITLGGASVGDHDLVGPVLRDHGMALDFWKIAMRPGKPLMFGRLGMQRILGLPGNPVSSMITARLFAVPLVGALMGDTRSRTLARQMPLAVGLSANGPRAHYMRAVTAPGADGVDRVTPLANQDSSLVAPLAAANCLIIRPIDAPAVAADGSVPVLDLDF